MVSSPFSLFPSFTCWSCFICLHSLLCFHTAAPSDGCLFRRSALATNIPTDWGEIIQVSCRNNLQTGSRDRIKARMLACLLVRLAFSSLILFRTPWLGNDAESFYINFTIKTIPHTHAHRPTWCGHFLIWDSLSRVCVGDSLRFHLEGEDG